MTVNRKTRGDVVNSESPNWGPLNSLLGLDLSAGFMWMFEIELRNRTRLHAYKHCDTRRYIYITQDGRCYGYLEDNSYRQITQYQAICGVFDLWPAYGERSVTRFTPRERAILDFTRRYASFDLLDPGQPCALLAGPGVIVDDELDEPSPDEWLTAVEPDDDDANIPF